MIVVMVSGRAGEGKTTFSNVCINTLKHMEISSKIVPFAKGVKDVARSMGWDGIKDEKGRTLLQQIGNCGRDYNPNVWADMAVKDLQLVESLEWKNDGKCQIVFIDDWRFPNEGNIVAKVFKDIIKVRIVRDKKYHSLLGTPAYNDCSETSLPSPEEDFKFSAFYDFIVINKEGIENLSLIAEVFIKEMLLPKLGG